MPAIGSQHTYTVTVNSVAFTEYWIGAAVVTQNEASEVDTLSIQFQAKGSSLETNLTEWKEIVLRVDSTAYFGGYIVRVTRLIDQDQPDNWNTYDVVAEGYETLLNRTPAVRRTYYGDSPADILEDLFDYALDPDGSPPNQAIFDVSTYVTSATWSGDLAFTVDGETLTDAIDRLALLSGAVWWIDAAKKLHFGPASSEAAPFSIASVAEANYSTTFPVNTRPAHMTDGSDIRNRITVHGGVRIDVVKNESFTGDGVTSRFQLANWPVIDMILITVDGALQNWGTYWYHSWDDYDVLIDWSSGSLYFDPENPPGGEELAEILVSYYYGVPVTVTVDDGTELGTSYATYGRWFDYEIIDRSISDEDAATALANAVLDEFRWAVTTGSLVVERLGIKPGQELTIDLPAVGLDDDYPVRRVVTEIRRNAARCEVSFGGRRQALGLALNRSAQAGPLSASTLVAERHNRTLSNISEKTQGARRTESIIANTNTPSGATAYAMPIYDATGAIAGYVPVYGSSW